MKNIFFFYLKIFIFLVVKFSVYLNRHVFVMISRGNTILLYINFVVKSDYMYLQVKCVKSTD